MTVFFGILFSLIGVNALLLIFSVNGAKEGFQKKIKKASDTATTKLFPQQISEGEYKEAV